ncbi:EAL domain-containing protein, partial [Acinetobacter baumannii]
FVEHLETSRQSAAIVSALVALARTLELELVGEGIETPAQSALIASLGCPLQQGFVFSRALPAEDFVRWMEGYERLGSASRSA